MTAVAAKPTGEVKTRIVHNTQKNGDPEHDAAANLALEKKLKC